MGTRKVSNRYVVGLRIAQGMTFAQLAAAARVGTHTIQRAEQGLPIGSDSRDRLAAVLGPLTYEYVDVVARGDVLPALPDDAPPAMVARYSRSLSLKDAARAIGISHRTLTRAERGKGIQLRTARAIADFYGIPVDDVYFVPDPETDVAAVA